jgi:hypothetical protein
MSNVDRRDIMSKLGAAAAAFAAASVIGMSRVLAEVPVTFNKLRAIKIAAPNPCGPGEFTVVTQATREGLVVKGVTKGKTGTPGFSANGEHIVHVTVDKDHAFTLAGLDDVLNKTPGRGGSSSSGGGSNCTKC